MYTATYLTFGKSYFDKESVVVFEEETLKDLDDLNLLNYTMDEEELGRPFYLMHYGDNLEKKGHYVVVVKQGDEEGKKQARETLLTAAVDTLESRIIPDLKILALVQEAQRKLYPKRPMKRIGKNKKQQAKALHNPRQRKGRRF